LYECVSRGTIVTKITLYKINKRYKRRLFLGQTRLSHVRAIGFEKNHNFTIQTFPRSLLFFTFIFYLNPRIPNLVVIRIKRQDISLSGHFESRMRNCSFARIRPATYGMPFWLPTSCRGDIYAKGGHRRRKTTRYIGCRWSDEGQADADNTAIGTRETQW